MKEIKKDTYYLEPLDNKVICEIVGKVVDKPSDAKLIGEDVMRGRHIYTAIMMDVQGEEYSARFNSFEVFGGRGVMDPEIASITLARAILAMTNEKEDYKMDLRRYYYQRTRTRVLDRIIETDSTIDGDVFEDFINGGEADAIINGEMTDGGSEMC